MLAVTLLMLVLPAQPPPTTAAEWFSVGRAQSRAGEFEAALDAFLRSHTLDPTLGTLLNIADCHERLGHLLDAHRLYDEALEWARRNKDHARVEFAEEHLAALLRRLARVEVQPAERDTVILVNGVRAEARRARLVPPGPVAIRVTATAKVAWETTLLAEAGQAVVVAVPVLSPALPSSPPLAEAPLPHPKVNAAPSNADPVVVARPVRPAAVVLLTTGLAAAIAGGSLLGVTLEARLRWEREVRSGLPLEARSVTAAAYQASHWGVPTGAVGAALGAGLVAAALIWGLHEPSPASAWWLSPRWGTDGLGATLGFRLP